MRRSSRPVKASTPTAASMIAAAVAAITSAEVSGERPGPGMEKSGGGVGGGGTNDPCLLWPASGSLGVDGGNLTGNEARTERPTAGDVDSRLQSSAIVFTGSA